MNNIYSYLEEVHSQYLQTGKGDSNCIEIASQILENFEEGDTIMIYSEDRTTFKTIELGEEVDGNNFHVVFLMDEELVIDPLYSSKPVNISNYLNHLREINNVSFSYTNDW